jgi:hypothetical protein
MTGLAICASRSTTSGAVPYLSCTIACIVTWPDVTVAGSGGWLSFAVLITFSP